MDYLSSKESFIYFLLDYIYFGTNNINTFYSIKDILTSSSCALFTILHPG